MFLPESWDADREILHALAFSPDGRFLASTGADGTVKVWDVSTKKPRAVLLGHRANQNSESALGREDFIA